MWGCSSKSTATFRGKVKALIDRQAYAYNVGRLEETAEATHPAFHKPTFVLSCFSPFNFLVCMHIVVTIIRAKKNTIMKPYHGKATPELSDSIKFLKELILWEVFLLIKQR